jgi:3-phenylpropionate/cinnamic acid dioxygenase small subunit
MSVNASRFAELTPEPDRQRVEQFLFREARLADEHRYDEWEQLWAEEALYWVPIREDLDPDSHISYIYDNRARIASRIRQLKTGRRHAQAPQSQMRRIIANLEIRAVDGGVETRSNFLLTEARRGELITWAGQAIHRLVEADGDFRIREKQVLLVNRGDVIRNLAFLI